MIRFTFARGTRTLGPRWIGTFAGAVALLCGAGVHAQAAAPAAPVPSPPADSTSVKPPEARGVTASVYGFVELDLMHDSTQSFSEAIVNNTMARPSTLAGDNPRTQFSARDSRVGVKLAAPVYGSIRTSGLVEVDFFGNQPTPASEDATVVGANIRLRHVFVKFETPFVDVLAGQTHDLFGWGGAGFYPATVAFLGVPGEVYHRDPQLRVSKTLSGPAATFEIAAAAVRPAQRDGEIPDAQGGLRFALNRWKGASTQGASQPKAAPLSVGISGLYRRFSVPAFTSMTANPNKANGWGASVNLFLPLIPAKSDDDLGNSLSATGEATMGQGIANLYTGLTGGVLFPALPNPMMTLPVPTYNPDIDEGLVTYDAAGQLHAVKWRALVVGLQYRAPFGKGRRLGLSAVASQIESTNVDMLTPQQGLPSVFSKAQYADGNVFWSPTPESQVGASVQVERQTFGDGVYDTNVRGELAVYYFF